MAQIDPSVACLIQWFFNEGFDPDVTSFIGFDEDGNNSRGHRRVLTPIPFTLTYPKPTLRI
jgi:hypothetical protein